MKIAFLGLGIMGREMAGNLIDAGFDVTLWNRTYKTAKEVAGKKGKVASTIKEALKNKDVVITMLSTPQAVEEVLTMEDGLAESIDKKALWIDATTVGVKHSEFFATLAEEMNINYIDAPVAGSKVPAKNGELVFLAGSDEENLKKIQPLLDAMGKKTIFAGSVTNGVRLKLVVNLLLGMNMAAFSEALLLGENLGLEKDFLLDLLPDLPVTAPIIKLKKEKFRNNDIEAEFPLRWMHKDLELVSECAYDMDITLPSSNSVKDIFGLAKNFGYGDNDFMAIYNFLNSGKDK